MGEKKRMRKKKYTQIVLILFIEAQSPAAADTEYAYRRGHRRWRRRDAIRSAARPVRYECCCSRAIECDCRARDRTAARGIQVRGEGAASCGASVPKK